MFALDSKSFSSPSYLVSCIKENFAKRSFRKRRPEAVWTKQLREKQPDLLDRVRSAIESDVAPLLLLMLRNHLKSSSPVRVWTGFQHVLANRLEWPNYPIRGAVLRLLIVYDWTCETPVFHTTRHGSADDLAFVLAAGYNPNQEGIPLSGDVLFSLIDVDPPLRRPLFFAAYHGLLEKVRLLHESGVSHEPMYYQQGFNTALHYAVAGSHSEVVEFLCNTGKYKNVLELENETDAELLFMAMGKDSDGRIVQSLMKAGANPKARLRNTSAKSKAVEYGTRPL